MKKRHADRNGFVGWIGTAAVFAAVIVLFVTGVLRFSRQAGEEGTKTLEDGIRRASVQCYAIEGRYPPSVQYLEDNYGIKIDTDRYHVFYEGFASNIMPDITVIPADEQD